LRFRGLPWGLVLTLLVAPLLVFFAGQNAWAVDNVACVTATVASTAGLGVRQIREEIGGNDIDLSTYGVRITLPRVLISRRLSHRPQRPEADTEVASLSHPLHRRILPCSSDDAG
jgi:hypothetical protein